MSLRTQVAGLLLILSLIVVAVSYSVQSLVILPAFAQLERDAAERNVRRCVDAITAEIEAIANTAHDWSAWDDNYLYVQGKNPTFQAGNLMAESFSNTQLNLICIVNEQREILWGQSRDFETLEVLQIPDLFELILSPESPLIGWTEIDRHATGILPTSQGPMMLSARPVITTKHEGPVRGWLVMGRLLSDSRIANLAEQTHCMLQAWQFPSETAGPQELGIFESIKNSDQPFVQAVDSTVLNGYMAIRDLLNRPCLLLKVELDRKLMAQGSTSARIATACSLLGGLFTLGIIWFVLSRQIVRPLQQMAAHAARVGSSDDLKARLNVERSDEIGVLAHQFDQMVENLAESRNKVLEHAHRAGMAEIASEVLHNVGNAVNSANCSVEFLDETLKQSKLTGLARANELLRQVSDDPARFFQTDPRAPKLLGYLGQLEESLQRERETNLHEVARLHKTIRHIRDAIAAQQSVAGRSDFKQEVALSDLIEEVLVILEPELKLAGIEVHLEIEQLEELKLNKNKFSQVLMNLVRNAIQAMTEGCSRRLLSIRARVAEGCLTVDVSDTGVGFDDAVRVQLFTQGFTTKAAGRGLGLHFCANALHEAGGAISARSAGPNQGATFSVRLPTGETCSSINSSPAGTIVGV